MRFEPARPENLPSSEPFRPPAVQPAPDAGQQQALAAEQARKREAFERLAQRGDFPLVLLTASDAPDVRERARPLTGEVLENANYLQTQMLRLLPTLVRAVPGNEAAQRNLRELEQKLRKEQSDHVFGEASKETYGKLVDWLQGSLAGRVMALERMGLPIPPGVPLSLPTDSDQRSRDPQLFMSQVAAGLVPVNLGLDRSRLPTTADADKIEQTLAWLGRSTEVINTSRAQFTDQQLEQEMRRRGLQGWLDRMGATPEEWRSSATRLIDLTTKVENYVAAMDSLHRENPSFPFVLPPGASVKREGGRESGKIVELTLDLPRDVRQDHPGNRERIERLQRWLNTHGERTDRTLDAVKRATENPDRMLMWGDVEVQNAQARFDSSGNFVGIARRGDAARPGENLRDCNLVEHRFSAQTRNDEHGQPKVYVRHEIQAQQVPWWGYQNWVWDNVGDKLQMPEVAYSPDEFVPIRNGDRVELIQAKNLEHYINTRKLIHHGEKTLVAAMDAAMLVTGMGEIAGVVKACKLASLTRVVAGGTGVLNNAGARDTELGQTINNTRGIYFLSDVGLGLGRQVLSTVRGAEQAGQAATNAGRLWRGLHAGGEFTFRATEIPFAGSVATELWHQSHELAEPRTRDRLEDARRLRGDSARPHYPERAFGRERAEVVQASRQLLEQYSTMLQNGRNEQTRTTIEEIFQNTSRLIGPEATDEERTRYRERLLSHFVFDSETIKQLELINRGPLSPQQLTDMRDPEKLSGMNRQTQRIVQAALASQNRDVQAAAAVALVYLGRDASGRLPSELASARTTVPTYTREEADQSRVGSKTVTVQEHQVSQELKTQELVALLYRDMDARDLGMRGVVTGELLYRIGALSEREYATVLQDVLRNPGTSNEDKLNVMVDTQGPRLASLLNAMRRQDAGPRKNDTATTALEETLVQTAINPNNDKNVRAMASMIKLALSEGNDAARQEMLQLNQRLWREKGAQEYAGTVQQFLKDRLVAPIPESSEQAEVLRMRKFSAALALSRIADHSDQAQQKLINHALVDSFPQSRGGLSRATAVLEALSPERVQQLDPADSARLNELSLKLLNLPGRNEPALDEQEEQSVRRLITDLPRVLDDNHKRILSNRLGTFLLDGTASQYPLVRQAAVKALAEMGARGQLEAIRSHATVTTEPDANVRRASIEALAQMNDTEFLRSRLVGLLQQERDPAVSQALRDLELPRRTIEPGTQQFQEQLNRTLKALLDEGGTGRYPELRTFDDRQVIDFVTSRYPLLDNATYQQERKRAADDAVGMVRGFFKLQPSIDGERMEAVEAVMRQQRAQFEELSQLALRDTREGHQAKIALTHILLHGGQPIASAIDDRMSQAVPGTVVVTRNDGPFWQKRAAEVLNRVANSGAPGSDIAVHALRRGLAQESGLGADASRVLLEGWRQLHRNGKISLAEAATITAGALELEHGRRRAEQNEQLQLELLGDLNRYGYRLAYPVLTGIAESPEGRGFGTVRDKAREVLGNLRDSVQTILDRTQPDRTGSTPEARSHRISVAYGRRLESTSETQIVADDFIQEMFNNYKGTVIGDQDPGIPVLAFALNDNNERIKLAAAMLLARAQVNVEQPDRKKALQTLAELVLSGTQPRYRTEAYAVLNDLPNNSAIAIQKAGGALILIQKDANGVRITESVNGSVRRQLGPADFPALRAATPIR